MNSDNYHGSHSVLIEAESFDNKGGWKVDQQFVHSMGSPYLLAHGMGVPVANAKTKATFPGGVPGTQYLIIQLGEFGGPHAALRAAAKHPVPLRPQRPQRL